ncbi:hypothetical protein [Nostoc sp. CALU 1950]
MAKILGKHRSTVQRWLADYCETFRTLSYKIGIIQRASS